MLAFQPWGDGSIEGRLLEQARRKMVGDSDPLVGSVLKEAPGEVRAET